MNRCSKLTNKSVKSANNSTSMHYGIDVDIYMAALDVHRSWVLALFAENKEISLKSLNLEWLWQ